MKLLIPYKLLSAWYGCHVRGISLIKNQPNRCWGENRKQVNGKTVAWFYIIVTRNYVGQKSSYLAPNLPISAEKPSSFENKLPIWGAKKLPI